jgi:ABC-type transport system involved in cytochrome c biogenesis ATPase subunit
VRPVTALSRRITGMTYAIEAHGLTKRFGSTQALAGIDLAAREGTVLGVLGPNGAGKTTAVRVLATLLQADSGTARVAGLDVRTQAAAVRSMIGLTGQYASVDEDLTGTQNLVMIGQLLDLTGRDARTRAAELLEWFDLTEAAERTAKTYSGGMRRRLDLAAVGGQAGEPHGVDVVGLDDQPVARAGLLDVLRAAEGAPEPGHQGLQGVGRVDRLLVVPDGARELGGRHRATGVHGEAEQEPAQPLARHVEDPSVRAHLERAEIADLHAGQSRRAQDRCQEVVPRVL